MGVLALVVVAYSCIGAAIVAARMVASRRWQQEMIDLREGDIRLGKVTRRKHHVGS